MYKCIYSRRAGNEKWVIVLTKRHHTRHKIIRQNGGLKKRAKISLNFGPLIFVQNQRQRPQVKFTGSLISLLTTYYLFKSRCFLFHYEIPLCIWEPSVYWKPKGQTLRWHISEHSLSPAAIWTGLTKTFTTHSSPSFSWVVTQDKV